MTATDYLSRDWKALLDDAETERDLVVLARDYLAMWTPQEIAELPVDCRPGPVRDGEDITYWAFEFTRRQIAATEDDPALAARLLKLRTFFSHAAERLSFVTAAAARATADRATPA